EGARVQLRDAGLAHAELGADVLELDAVEVVHAHDAALALRELLDRAREGPVLRSRLDPVEWIFALDRAMEGLLERLVGEAHDGVRTAPSAGRRLRGGRQRAPGPAREPVLGAELVEHRASDAGARVPRERFTLVPPVPTERIDEPEHPGGDEVVPE